MKSPKDIYKYVDKYVEGQEDAKKLASNTVFWHYLRYISSETGGPRAPNKTNLLIMGPSGCGKTYILEKAAENVELPFHKINARCLTNTGYVGTTIESYLTEFYMATKDSRKFEYSIIFIDEIDKICQDPGSSLGGWQKNLQYSLLKTLEGDIIRIRSYGTIDTSNMLFVLAGNFEGIREDREKVSNPMGFNGDMSDTYMKTFHEELINFGMVREFAGRIANVSEIHSLTEDQLYSILCDKENSPYEHYTEMFKYFNIKFKLKKSELQDIAKKAVSMGTGARGLHTCLNNTLRDFLFSLNIDTEKFYKKLITKEPEEKSESKPQFVFTLDDDSYSGGFKK